MSETASIASFRPCSGPPVRCQGLADNWADCVREFGLIVKPKEATIEQEPYDRKACWSNCWNICCGRDAAGAAARLSQLPLEKRALAATAEGKRRSARQRERIDVAVDAPRLLGVAEPE